LELADIDLVDLDRFTAGFPHAVFTHLREHAPVWWHPPRPKAPGGEGFWVISRHAETLAVLRDHETFSSESGGERSGGGTTLEDMPRGVGPGVMLNMMDPPRHSAIRLLVNKGFKPRVIAGLEAELRERARRILATVGPRGRCDFLVEVAAELPLQAIAGLLGLPQADRHQMFDWTTAIVDYSDRDLGQSSERLREAAAGLADYGRRLIARRRAAPESDMFSIIVHAEIPGDDGVARRLADEELLPFFMLLLVAGSETTRNAIAGGLLALLEHPGELARLRSDASLLPTAVEEILRWTSPTTYNRRTVTRDTELGGQELRAGEKLTHWYPSANRDAQVFEDPFRSDVARQPNPHLAFGNGQHHCLGASLARTEIRLIFEELLPRWSDLALDGPVEWARSNKHGGIRHLPIRFAARGG